MDADFSLKSKTILVTGASSGIGRKIAISLSNQGACVIITGRDLTRLQMTYELLPGQRHLQFKADLTDALEVEALLNKLPNLDGVVHSAGLLHIAPLKILSEMDAEKIMQINYFAPLNLTKNLLNKKKLVKNSSVVFISSVNGVYTYVKGFGAYSASKAALSSISKVFALEYGARKIRFNSINPGMIKTEMYEKMTEKITIEDINIDKLKYPLGDYGETEDIANACIYLLSNASKWVTGIDLIVDGGLTII